jgi:Copper chaperone
VGWKLEKGVIMTTKIQVSGMTCGSCVSILERSLKTVPGVETATVDLRKETATVEGSADVSALVATTKMKATARQW